MTVGAFQKPHWKLHKKGSLWTLSHINKW